MNTSPEAKPIPNVKPPPLRSRVLKRIGQVLAVSGLLTLLVAGPLQPRVAAMRSVEGLYIPNAHYQFTPHEVTSQTKTLSHTFTLYNGRSRPLQIEASADCGCTGLSWNSTMLPPFGRKEITASMNSSNNFSNVGLQFKVEGSKYTFATLKQ